MPKGHTPGKWRLIVDISFPAGGSVNDGIDPGLCSLQYTSADVACQKVLELGKYGRYDQAGEKTYYS